MLHLFLSMKKKKSEEDHNDLFFCFPSTSLPLVVITKYNI